ncbi:hypothetical protein M3B46_19170, partial [Sphingobacterium daejeonense]|uniref:hypothetical protein n=1 Tax=Sphingobacterium daejeonense TaxID=371142 RepID=UPI0021A93440
MLRKFKLLNEKREKICFPFVNFVLSHAPEGNTLAVPEVQLAVGGASFAVAGVLTCHRKDITPFNPV